MMRNKFLSIAGLGFCVLFLAGCTQEMRDDSRLKPYEASDFFEDGRTARPLVEDTVARGHLQLDTHLYQGRVAGKMAKTFPFAVTREILDRGRERYNIFCSVCHDQVGNGEGMVVRRGFKQPQTFHSARSRKLPPGYFFQVMTRGYIEMPGYADVISPEDRWAIAAYIRALQLSQNASLQDVPGGERHLLDESREENVSHRQ